MLQQRFGKQSRFTLAMLSALAVGGAMVGSTAHAVNSASTVVSATVIRPIAITKSVDLAFGTFAPSDATTSDITVYTNGSRAVTGGAYAVGTASTAAKFDVTGEGGSTYAITYTVPATLTDGLVTPTTMNITVFSEMSATAVAPASRVATGLLAGTGAGTQSIYVGAKLDLAINQKPGSYSGQIDVAVNYN